MEMNISFRIIITCIASLHSTQEILQQTAFTSKNVISQNVKF